MLINNKKKIQVEEWVYKTFLVFCKIKNDLKTKYVVIIEGFY